MEQGFTRNLIFDYFRNRIENLKFPLKYGKNNVALHKELRIFIIVSLSLLLILRNVLDKGNRENKFLGATSPLCSIN